MVYDEGVYCGFIIRGDLRGAMSYIKRYPECKELYDRYISLFDDERYITYDVRPMLNVILRSYQQYYRDVFYLLIGKSESAELLRNRLSRSLRLSGSFGIDDLEQGPIKEAFVREGFHFLGGKTGGYYGPYVWSTTETETYDVELPDGIQKYTVRLLGGFITKSWIDYLSFGKLGTGGWTDNSGIICCVRSSYDLDSENYKVSLLKHEAQHAKDLKKYGGMSSDELEYRAKLVELIYSSERNLLPQFFREADNSSEANGHATAAHRIIEGFREKLNADAGELDMIPIWQIQKAARELFAESNRLCHALRGL